MISLVGLTQTLCIANSAIRQNADGPSLGPTFGGRFLAERFWTRDGCAEEGGDPAWINFW